MPYADWFNEALATALTAALPPPPELETDALADGAPSDATEDLGLARVVRARLSVLLQEANANARAGGLSAEDMEAADFAVCAFIDEVLLSSNWSGREEWMANPLQLERHATGTAGEEFFRVLDLLLEKSESALIPISGDDVETQRRQASLTATLEIFALCLAHGFTGIYFHDAQALRQRLDRLAKRVPNVAAGLAPLAREPGLSAYPDAPARHAGLNGLRRFDALDCLLWLVPPLVVGLLHHVCGTRLDELLTVLRQGG